VLITGATGFIGSALLRHLAADGRFDVIGTSRGDTRKAKGAAPILQVGELGANTDWGSALEGVEAIVHTAARVHQMDESPEFAAEKYCETNVAGTVRLAEVAVRSGVRRFVFLSSVKVNGERTEAGAVFDANSTPAPSDPYGISKLEAERQLQEVCSDSGMELVIIRPTLVYGPGVGANFEALMRWVYRGVPLPLAGIDNRRSMIALENLTSLITACLQHPCAPGNIFFAADGEDLSTSNLLQRVGGALGKQARLFWVPKVLLRGLAALIGQSSRARRLLESLQVDTTPVREILGWQPPVSVDEGILAAATAFRAKVRP
jgi:nucleoside-diphosphate-sugar epimerase